MDKDELTDGSLSILSKESRIAVKITDNFSVLNFYANK